MIAVKRWMKTRHLDANIRQRIQRFYSEVWIQQQDDQEEEFLNEIPQDLRTAVAFQATESCMKNIDLFNHVDDSFLQLIASRFQPIFVPEGDDVYKEGDDADALFILDEGELTIKNKFRKLGKFYAPEIVGEGCLLKNQDDDLKQRIVTLTCAKECRLWKMELEDLERLMKLSPDLKDNFMKGIREYVVNKIQGFSPQITQQVRQKLVALKAGTEDIDDNLPYDGAIIAMIRTLGLEGKLDNPMQSADSAKDEEMKTS
eukprot:TRINITY_DN1999_c1_g3_i1.p3 TRINITY_DN1999_c1_g3~~TRINITY_DN1999_c1_g3_i1.p3  ORF type:complete len:258 (+),score=34.20 TRINITY_DN1999_c1_g3_i1:1038-1811(+)